MPTLRKISLYSSIALGTGVMAGAVWFLCKKLRRQSRPRPPPIMAEWEFWKSSRKIATLPPSINDPRGVFKAHNLRENTLDPLHPDTSVFLFGTRSHVLDVTDGSEPHSSIRYTLWRHSFLTDQATPFCTFEIPLSIVDFLIWGQGPRVEFMIFGQYLLIGLNTGNSMSILVLNRHGELLRQIQLEDSPVITGDRISCFSFDENHCHLFIITPPVASCIESFKFDIAPKTNRASCIQRNTIQLPQGKESRLCWSFPDCTGFQMIVEGEMADVSDPWIRYDHTSGALTVCEPEEMFSGRLVNWRHQLNMTISLFNFQEQKFFNFQERKTVYRGSHQMSTVAGLTSVRERYFVCRKEMGGESSAEEEEEEEQSSSNLNIYSLRSEPKSLRSLALSAVLKKCPQVKDLPQKEMTAFGIPSDVAAAFEKHKIWQSDPCVHLGVL